MRVREGLPLGLAVAAALVAAWHLRVAVHPEQIHDSRHARAWAEATRALPVLGAVRVRSEEPLASHLLATRGRGAFEAVLDPRDAATVFRYGRLLYLPPEKIRAIDEALRRRERPDLVIPEPPDLSPYFHAEAGAFACDVILRRASGLQRIRELVPDAQLSGEPVAREREQQRSGATVRALIATLATLFLWLLWRRDLRAATRRLLVALVPVALLGLLDLGIDAWSLAAALLVAAAPAGFPLVVALPCLLLPSLALRRIAFVLVAGGLVSRTLPPRDPGGRPSGATFVSSVLVASIASIVVALAPIEPVVTDAVPDQPAALIVPVAQTASRAVELRAEGLGPVVGDRLPLPPDPDRETRSRLRNIFRLADLAARTAPPDQRPFYRRLAEAAAGQNLYLRSPLRERLRTRDGRAVLWVHGAPPGREEFLGARWMRMRGDLQLRREAGIATIALFLLVALVVRARQKALPLARLLPAALGLVAGCAMLLLPLDQGAPFAPLLAAFGWLSGPAWPALLVVAAAFDPRVFLAPAAGAWIVWGGALLVFRRRTAAADVTSRSISRR